MAIKKNLVFASASFHPWNRGKLKFKKKDFLKREINYLVCLDQLKRVTPKNFEIYIVENTVSNIGELISDDLVRCLDNMNILFVPEKLKKESPNIGVAELNQLIYLHEKINFDNYSKICYFSARRFITNPYVFERTERLNKKALISNPDFIYLNGKVVHTEKTGMFNDMFFSMDSKTMKEYVSFSINRLEYLEANMVNSETNLFDFISKFNISYEELPSLGFLRYDYYNKSKKEDEKYHIV